MSDKANAIILQVFVYVAVIQSSVLICFGGLLLYIIYRIRAMEKQPVGPTLPSPPSSQQLSTSSSFIQPPPAPVAAMELTIGYGSSEIWSNPRDLPDVPEDVHSVVGTSGSVKIPLTSAGPHRPPPAIPMPSRGVRYMRSIPQGLNISPGPPIEVSGMFRFSTIVTDLEYRA
ncbi:hypothetical protein FRC02_003123 [Tulasnella sp. 418]|nr:hypothetical protein FRC02_003123 [Tulasnella sp. 418]